MVGFVPKLASYCSVNNNNNDTLLSLPLSCCAYFQSNYARFVKLAQMTSYNLRQSPHTCSLRICLSLFKLQLCTAIALASHLLKIVLKGFSTFCVIPFLGHCLL